MKNVKRAYVCVRACVCIGGGRGGLDRMNLDESSPLSHLIGEGSGRLHGDSSYKEKLSTHE